MLYAHGLFVPQGYSTATAPSLRFHSRPVLAFGYCRCIRLSVCPCVRVCINPKLVRAITQVPLKPSSPNLGQRWKTPWLRFLLWGDQIDIKISLVPGFGTSWFGRLQGPDCFMVSTLCTYSSRQPMVFLRLTSLLFYIGNTKLEPCASISECTPERSQRRFFHKTTNSASTKTHTLSQVAQHLKYPIISRHTNTSVCVTEVQICLVITVNLILNHGEIEKVSTCNFLGIVLDDNINWKPHIENFACKLAKYCGVLSKLKTSCHFISYGHCIIAWYTPTWIMGFWFEGFSAIVSLNYRNAP